MGNPTIQYFQNLLIFGFGNLKDLEIRIKMKLLYDTRLIFLRSLQITLRNPVWIVFGLFQPLCFLLLFAPLLEKIAGNPAFGSSNSLTVFTPGLLIMIALY